jgi:RNA polymerase sigma factor (TIGR02999 family)
MAEVLNVFVVAILTSCTSRKRDCLIESLWTGTNSCPLRSAVLVWWQSAQPSAILDDVLPHPPAVVPPMTEVTRILSAIEHGDALAASKLLPLVYDELRKLAATRMAQEKPGQTLQATALVHEAYLRLVDTENSQAWNSRGHFFAAAAEAMRWILVENASRKNTQKHGGARQRVELAEIEVASHSNSEAWLLLDDALAALVQEDQTTAKIAKLHLFAGLPVEHAGELLGISRASAFRHWTYARAWLQARLQDADSSE